MKVDQIDETNSNTHPVRPPHIPSIANSQLSPSGSSARKHETPGILSRMFPPFVGITSYHVRAYLAPRIASLCFVMLCLLRIYRFFPPLLLRQTPRPALMPPSTTTSQTTLLPVQQSFQASPPLITRYRLFFSILLALEQCCMLLLSINPILLHSMSLLLLLLSLPAILLLSIGCQCSISGPTLLCTMCQVRLAFQHLFSY